MKTRNLLFLFSLMILFSSCKERHHLFNGNDLTGWVAYVDEAAPIPADEVFQVQNGNIYVKGLPFGYLRTERKYKDYTLHAEWRWVNEPANSGLFQRVQDGDLLWCTAIECQLCNGKAGDFVMLGGSKIEEVECVGKFPIKERKGDYEKQSGKWNKAKIVCTGNKIKVYINGKFQNECTCEFTEGYIALQSEGGPVEFKNIYLTDFTPMNEDKQE